MCPQCLADLLEDNRVAFEREFHGSNNASKITSKAKAAALERYECNMKAYQKQKKAETDFMLKERRKEASGQAIRWASIQYTGHNTLSLCTMSLAQQCCLKAGQNIMDKELVKL